jgi:DNA topoisomerase VI subunit B
MASVWVPFTSESKEAIAALPEIIREITFCLQECGRRPVGLPQPAPRGGMERKRSYIEMYLPHLALGLKQVLALNDRVDEERMLADLRRMLEAARLEPES